MALILKDRVKETATSPGTGSVTLLGAAVGFQAFSVIGNTNTCYYTISDQGGPNWEVGIGTYSTTGPTLARTTVLDSSNAGSLTNFNAGTQDVFITYPSEKGVWLDASGNAIGLGTPAAFVGTNITGTASGLTAGTVTTNANLTGPITSVGNATSIASQTGTGTTFAMSASPTFTGTVGAADLTTTGNTILGNASTDTLNVGNGDLIKDASGNVGIGVTPSAWYTGASSKAVQISTYGALWSTNANVRLNGNVYYNSVGGAVYLNTGAASEYLQDAGAHTWKTVASGTAGTGIAGGTYAWTTAMTLDASGGLKTLNTIGVGNATPSTSGAGITFPATQSASTDANTLDDYEEGTWTPAITFGGNAVGVTYSASNSAFYTKIGNRVYVTGYLILTSKGSSTGAVSITGLPFTSANSFAATAPVVFYPDAVTYSGMITPVIVRNTTTISCNQTSILGVQSVLTDTNFANGSNIAFSASYQV